MEVRKVQRLGSSSYIVTLPASWVRKYELKAGDSVVIVEEDGYLKIKPAEKISSHNNIKIKLSKINNSDFSDDTINCLISLGFDKINIEYTPSFKSIVEKLADSLDITVKIKDGFIEISSKNELLSTLADDLKDMGKIVVSLIDNLFNSENEEINATQLNIFEKLLQMKFYNIRRRIFRELISKKDNDIIIISTTEKYAMINELYSLSLKLLRIAEILVSRNNVNHPAIKDALHDYSNAMWELFAGLANNSMKRLAFSKNKLKSILSKLNELDISINIKQALQLLIYDTYQLASKAETCIKTIRIIEDNSKVLKEKTSTTEIIV